MSISVILGHPFFRRTWRSLRSYIERKNYERWLQAVRPDPGKTGQRLESLDHRPLFSVVVPAYNSHPGFLKELIRSIRHQSYPHFEVLIADDGSTMRKHIEDIRSLAQLDSRFKLILGKRNRGIAANTNRALDAATGEYIVFCDHDDRIEPFSLEMLAIYINRFPDADLFYSDEDMMDERGRRHSPRLQPDWNPDMFTSHMYFMHLICCKKSALDRVGRMNSAFDGAQDHDFFLRFTELAKAIIHIPYVLYSWRVVTDSLASNPTAKLYAYDSGTRAIEAAMERRGVDAAVLKAQGAGLGVYRVKRLVRNPTTVTHVVEGGSEAVWLAVKSIRSAASIPVEIIIVMESEETTEKPSENFGVRVVNVEKGTNRAAKFNLGARMASGEHLLFSTENVEVLDSDYPLGMLEHTQRAEIGAVGVKLIYPDGTFFHTGMILGVNGVAGYAHRGLFQGAGYWRYAVVVRNYSAVSWEMMGVRRETFFEAGLFDEALPFFQDVDFCLRLLRIGYRNLYTPYVAGVLKRKTHLVSELRNRDAATVLLKRHGEMIRNDPSYHPFHTKCGEDFGLYRNIGDEK
jgi:glycosyltransferase involved in cell wall biosynthesis